MRKKSPILLIGDFLYKVGDKFSYRGQIYSIIKIEPYTRKDGVKVKIGFFETICPECFEKFECSLVIPFKGHSPNRRCGECKDPLKRVKLSKKYKESYLQ